MKVSSFVMTCFELYRGLVAFRKAWGVFNSSHKYIFFHPELVQKPSICFQVIKMHF